MVKLGAVVAACVTSLAAPFCAHASLPASMDVVPVDVLVAVGTVPFDRLDREMSGLLIGAEITTLSNLGQVIRIVGLDEGFDQTRGLAFAVVGADNAAERLASSFDVETLAEEIQLDPDTGEPIKPETTNDQPGGDTAVDGDQAETSPPLFSIVGLLPVDGSGALLASLNGSEPDDAGVVDFTFAGEAYVARPIEGGYLAIAAERWALDAAAFGPGHNAAREAVLCDRASAIGERADVVGHLGETSRAFTQALLEQAFARFLNADESQSAQSETDAGQGESTTDPDADADAGIAGLRDVLLGLLDEGRCVTLGLDAAPLGMRIDAVITLDPDGTLHASTSQLETPSPRLDAVPARDTLVGVLAADTRAPLAKQLLLALTGSPAAGPAADAVTVGVYRAQRLPIDPVDVIVRWTDRGWAFDTATTAFDASPSIALEPRGLQAGTRTIDRWRTVRPDGGFGPVFSGGLARVQGGGMLTVSPTAAFTAAAIEHDPASGGAGRSIRGLSLLRQQLPGSSAVELFVNAGPLLDIFRPFLAVGGVSISTPANIPPIAAGVAFRDGAVHAGGFVSTQNLKILFELYTGLSR